MIKFKVKVMLAMRDMTQKELAERTGIRPPTVSAICTGSVKHLPVEALDKICDVLDCQPADLMEFVNDAPTKWLFHTGKRFLRLSAGGALFPPIGGNEKKAVFKSHI